MGNQGMTNWKFSAFFAIALMLVAGLFSTTAMAADGDGSIVITTPGAGQEAGQAGNLEAGSVLTQLVFRYTHIEADNMAGGLLQIAIPDKWGFAAADADNLNAGDATDPAVLSADKKTVTIPIPSTQTVDITLTRVTVPTPPRLTDGDKENRRELYTFTTKSRTRSGRLRNLNPTTEIPDPQPVISVGNIANNKGTVTIDPGEIYETYNESGDSAIDEGARRITITFTATGPMWNSTMTLAIPAELDEIDPDAKSGDSGHIRVLNRGGSDISYTPVAGRSVLIDIEEMDRGQGVEIIYYSEVNRLTANVPATGTGSPFTLRTVTGFTAPSTLADGAKIGTGDADPFAETGRLLRKAGSGTMMVSPMYVEIGSGLKDFTLTYEAKTKLRNATLRITVPAELLPPEVEDTNPGDGVDDSMPDRRLQAD